MPLGAPHQVKAVFLAEASRAFSKVQVREHNGLFFVVNLDATGSHQCLPSISSSVLQRVPIKSLPKGCQVEHIELYDLQGKRQHVLPES